MQQGGLGFGDRTLDEPAIIGTIGPFPAIPTPANLRFPPAIPARDSSQRSDEAG